MSWTNVHAGVPQGSILGSLLLLIYINDLADDFSSNVKVFADDTSLFSVVHDVFSSSRRWYRKLCHFYKVLNYEHPQYLFDLIPVRPTLHPTRNALNISLNTNHNFFKNSFFPSTIIEWNKLDPGLRKAESLSLFKTNILKFIRPSSNSVYNCHYSKGLKSITRLRLGLSHLKEHKFKHSFQDAINRLCSCGLDIESTKHFLLHCPQFVNERRTLLSTIGNINYKLLENTAQICHKRYFLVIRRLT